MIKTLEGILLSSPSAKKLAKFYQNTLGLKLKSEAVFGEHDEEFYEFDLGKTSLYIADHSEVRGTNPNPQRIILNFEVDNIEREITRLTKDVSHPGLRLYRNFCRSGRELFPARQDSRLTTHHQLPTGSHSETVTSEE